nr:hypothetical protein [candidate division Zixibacteria bacterium]
MRIGAIIFWLLVFFVTGSGYLLYVTDSDLVREIESIDNISLDNARLIKIRNTAFKLPYASVMFYKGDLYLVENAANNASIAFFTGTGMISYIPPDEIETQQIKRFYGSETLTWSFDQAYFAMPVGGDIIASYCEEGVPADPSYQVKTDYERIKNIPDKDFRYNLPFHLLKAESEGQSDYLYADFLRDKYHHTVYVRDPYAREPVSLYEISPEFKTPQMVSSVAIGLSENDFGYEEFDLYRYEIDLDISTFSRSDIRCTMYLRVLRDSLKDISLSLAPEYEIDSIGGEVIGYIKEKDRPELLLELVDYKYFGDTVKIMVYYRTNLFYHYPDYGVIQDNLVRWYPYHGFRQLSDYIVNYTIDKGYDFISVGRKTADSIISDRRILQFQSERPIAYVTFNYGLFDTVQIRADAPPITLYFLERRHNPGLFGHPAVRRVAEDVGGAFDLFNRIYTPYSFDRLDAAAMAVEYGQGSPGLVHLSEATFERNRKGLDDKFRAHEVAHQWWGHMVNPATYHDIWLSEGLAEFSAAWYVINKQNDSAVFKDILKRWKNDIVKSGLLNGKRSDGYRAGAITLGGRLRSEKSPGAYEAVVYYKAAYVINMLRFELYLATGDNRAFFEMLSEFCKRYSGRMTSTADFIESIRNYLGERADLFFRQWLFDWRVPKIGHSYNKTDHGAVELVIDVSESADYFETPYPVTIRLEDNGRVNRVYWIRPGVNRFVFTSDDKAGIKSVEFNPDHEILEQ